MVSSSQVISDLNSINKTFTSYTNAINSTTNIWEGPSHDNFKKCATEFVNEFKGPINKQMCNFATALDLNEKYEDIKEECKLTQIAYDNAVASEETELAAKFQQRLNTLLAEKERLATQIKDLLSQVISAKLDSVESINLDSVSITSVNTDDLLASMANVRKLGENETLESFYGEGYIQQVLDDIKEKYSGRDIAVQSALALIQLAADKGVKLDYDFGGAHDGTEVTTDDVLKGVDCSTFASYIVNQASTKSIPSMTTWALESAYSKYKVDYKDAQPGDLLNYNNGNQGHVEIIIENNPEEGYFITAEAKGSSQGIVLSKTSYSDCRSCGQDVYNMDEIYDK